MRGNEWLLLAGVALVLVAVFVLPRLRQVSVAQAHALLKDGAQVVDVRSRPEFDAGHLPRARNIPLDELEGRLAREVPDKSTAVLLHCQSGARSGMGVRVLRQAGYQRVFNLGSFARARTILETAGRRP